MIKLSKEQQAEEDARLAQDVLDNRIFKEVFERFETTFTEQLLDLEPEQKDAFPIIQAPRKYLRLIKNTLQNYADAKTAKEEKKVIT